ncbi:AbiH family protein [Leuconostoc mesenteroides]|uniref:AbiH family protein n=1 Tax=Leuconostoc mesenteroides TaxID=1245 RepID=UPI001CC0E3B2|nr:AbiH family protein [Leuconostoc mesenteroides]MBZ1513284.1 hypothetical protein [Leuconostoc mesenteroides]
MKITYIVGNGFDIHLGLNSRYIDFYNWLDLDENKKKFKTNSIAKNISTYVDEKRKNEMKEISPSNWESKIDWSDFEDALRLLVESYSRQADYEDDLEKLIYDLDELNIAMSQYLSEETEELYKHLNFNSDTVEKSLNAPLNKIPSERLIKLNNVLRAEFQNHSPKAISSDLSFINFNYTFLLRDFIKNTNEFNIDKVYENLVSKKVVLNKNILYPNGKFNDTPILGIGSEYDLPDGLNISQEQKIILCKDVYANYRSDGRIDQIKTRLEQADLIICYGLSLGISDAIFISQVLENLTKHSNQTAIFIMYDENFDITDQRYKSVKNKRIVKERLIDRYAWRHPNIDEEQLKSLKKILDNQVIIQFDNGVKSDENSKNFDYFPYESKANENVGKSKQNDDKFKNMQIEIN